MVDINKGISVIVCCYNSSNRLPETIHYLSRQAVPPHINWEIIIVNNASTDNTKETAQVEWNKHNSKVDFKIIDQPIAGLQAAREKGIEASNYEYLLFCDDDNWLSVSYINTAYEIMSSDDKIGILGGLSEPFFEQRPPKWFEENKFSFAVGKQAEKSGEIKGSVYGAGMILRKSAWMELINHGFSFNLSGRKGKKLTAGEDSEMCYAIRFMNLKVMYDERLKLQHFMPASRVDWKVLRKMFQGFGAQNICLIQYYYALANEEPKELYMKSWKKRAYNTLSWFINNPKYVLKAMFTNGEGDFNVLTVERKFGLLKGLFNRRNDYDKSFDTIKEFYKRINNF